MTRRISAAKRICPGIERIARLCGLGIQPLPLGTHLLVRRVASFFEHPIAFALGRLHALLARPEDLRPCRPQLCFILLRARIRRANCRLCPCHCAGRPLPPLTQHLHQRCMHQHPIGGKQQ